MNSQRSLLAGPASVELRLPFPPSINTYWRHIVINGQARVLLSAKGREYRDLAIVAVIEAGRPQIDGRLAVILECYPPDRRARDLDNFNKGVLDALTHANVWHDDSQIDDLRVIRCGVRSPGFVVVRIQQLGA